MLGLNLRKYHATKADLDHYVATRTGGTQGWTLERRLMASGSMANQSSTPSKSRGTTSAIEMGHCAVGGAKKLGPAHFITSLKYLV
jgi:hypothetical protein